MAESAFLVSAGIGLNSFYRTPFPTTSGITALKRYVGNSLLGLDAGNTTCAGESSPCGVRSWYGVGLYPETNLGFGVDELALHDPLIPTSYFLAWPVVNAGQNPEPLNVFAPSIDSLALARRYGTSYVLAGVGRPPPAGMVPVADIDNMELYRVPGAERFSFGAGGTVTGVSHPDDATYLVATRVTAPARLVMRVTYTPGWHATTGTGAPLAVRPAAGGAFLSVRVPPGTSLVRLSYWPDGLTAGFALAGAAVAVLVALGLGGFLVRRSRRRRSKAEYDAAISNNRKIATPAAASSVPSVNPGGS